MSKFEIQLKCENCPNEGTWRKGWFVIDAKRDSYKCTECGSYDVTEINDTDKQLNE